jgi:hypothetical protein
VSYLVAALLALLFALVQASAVPLLFLDPIAAPSLPVALIAAWAVARDPREVAPGLLLVAIVLGVLSTERTGWFVLALVPAAAAALPLEPLLARPEGAPPRTLVAGGVAALGVLAYIVLLALAGGVITDVPSAGDAMIGASIATAAVAVLLAAILVRTRPREVGLFA